MMRSLAVCFVFTIALLTLGSCKKCYVCDFGNAGTRELCSKDFDDGTSGLELTVDAYEAQGYKCTKK